MRQQARLGRDEMSLNRLLLPFVPAEAGPSPGRVLGPWIPAFAGMNGDWFNGGANLNSSRSRLGRALTNRNCATRTAALGGHVASCEDCAYITINACRPSPCRSNDLERTVMNGPPADSIARSSVE
jgi:hypothetical protein